MERKVATHMASNDHRSSTSIYTRFKPHIIMVLAQIGYCFHYFVAEASFDHGMNPNVYVTYRHIVAGLAVLPFAYILERKFRPKMTVALFEEIFILSLIGVALPRNMYYASLKYTSPTFITSMVNTISSMTFAMAVIIKLEILDVRSPRGIAKLQGALLSFAGVLIMTLYKGPIIIPLGYPPIHLQGSTSIHESWVKGSLLCIGSCILYSISYIMQAYTLKRYPAQLSLTAWMCIVGAAQSAIFTLCVEHKPAAWAIGFNIDLWSTIYGGVVASGILIFLQLWVTEEKGPVFVTMFNPLATILVAVSAYFVVGEKLYVGSLIGAGIVIFGLYLLLWGKEEDDNGAELKSIKSNFATEDPNIDNPSVPYTSGKEALKGEP